MSRSKVRRTSTHEFNLIDLLVKLLIAGGVSFAALKGCMSDNKGTGTDIKQQTPSNDPYEIQP